MRTGEDAISWGRNQITNPTQSWARLCLKFVRSCYGVNALYMDAGTAWDKATYKHRTSDAGSIPRGVPAFFETPGTADHIVLALGDGRCLTNDWSAPGTISVAKIADLERAWNAPLLGWTEDLNGVRVYTPKVVAKPDPTDPRIVRARNLWREQGVIDTVLLSEIRKSGDDSADEIALYLPGIRNRMASIYDALD